MDEAGWERRLELLWASIDDRDEEDFLAAMRELVAQRPQDDPVALFEHASAFDSTGYPDLAVGRYRQALERGLSGPRRRRAVIQLASTLTPVRRCCSSGQPPSPVAAASAAPDALEAIAPGP
jgi:hypothetical protein